MRNLIVFLYIVFIPWSCSSQTTPTKDQEQSEMKPSKNEGGILPYWIPNMIILSMLLQNPSANILSRI